jgi:hypothetical protein
MMDPYRNPLVGTMDLMERLAWAVSEEEVDAPAVLAPTDREYAETWGEVVRPKLEAVQKVLALPVTKEFTRKIGSDPLNLATGDMRRFQISEIERFRAVANSAGIKPE